MFGLWVSFDGGPSKILLDWLLDVRGKGGENDSKFLGLNKWKNGIIYWDGERTQVEQVLG